LEVIQEKNTIKEIKIIRGAPCGATWEAAGKLKGASISDAPIQMGLETQFFCTADPSGWDPINEKSPVHLAAELHKAAVIAGLKAVKNRIK